VVGDQQVEAVHRVSFSSVTIRRGGTQKRRTACG